MTTPSDFKIPSNDDHERICALFLGPKAENLQLLVSAFANIASRQAEGRKKFFPEDNAFISENIKLTPAYKTQAQTLETELGKLLDGLNDNSVPFYSPRYSAHMTSDPSLPAILGYISTMLYNSNNVAFEASPYTTRIELTVGKQMCKMMGYNTIPSSQPETGKPLAWGHITCDGTVANIESIWASQNLKFYPFSLRDAMSDNEDLKSIGDSFLIETCKGDEKLLKDCSVWEMLNLKVNTVLEIPSRLNEKLPSHISLDSILKKYLVQTVGRDALMKRWEIKQQPTIVLPKTKHYSWPKGVALTGIGIDNIKNIDLDRNARMDLRELRKYLYNCIKSEQAVYEVVAVIGTTEEGAVDRLKEIVSLRDELLGSGLSFVLHADAAWGGYFASMLPPLTVVYDGDDLEYYVPQVGLRADTMEQLYSLRDVDSITIDPHKAGYVPYPAGGLCYRDGRMRFLLTWTAPYIDQGGKAEDSIGIFGVEGSKPGAAASAVYLAHQVIGTDLKGYGTLLGEASFTCRRFASQWAAMSDDKTDFIVVPLNRLPCEEDPTSTLTVDDEKKFIREYILDKSNYDLVQDKKAMQFLNKLGSDLNINAFACNFRKLDGTVNTDIEEANQLNQRIFERLSAISGKDLLKVKFYITSTVFSDEDYGVCADDFKKRLGLKGNGDLFVLRNVVMSPFSTTHQFISELANTFRCVLEEEVANARKSLNTRSKALVGTGSKYI